MDLKDFFELYTKHFSSLDNKYIILGAKGKLYTKKGKDPIYIYKILQEESEEMDIRFPNSDNIYTVWYSENTIELFREGFKQFLNNTSSDSIYAFEYCWKGPVMFNKDKVIAVVAYKMKSLKKLQRPLFVEDTIDPDIDKELFLVVDKEAFKIDFFRRMILTLEKFNVLGDIRIVVEDLSETCFVPIIKHFKLNWKTNFKNISKEIFKSVKNNIKNDAQIKRLAKKVRKKELENKEEVEQLEQSENNVDEENPNRILTSEEFTIEQVGFPDLSYNLPFHDQMQYLVDITTDEDTTCFIWNYNFNENSHECISILDNLEQIGVAKSFSEGGAYVIHRDSLIRWLNDSHIINSNSSDVLDVYVRVVSRDLSQEQIYGDRLILIKDHTTQNSEALQVNEEYTNDDDEDYENYEDDEDDEDYEDYEDDEARQIFEGLI